MARLEIQSIEGDPATQMPVIILKVLGRGVLLPFCVGLFEAHAIALELQSTVTLRPMTHDLLRNAIQAMGGTVDRVAFTDLREGNFVATIYIQKDGEEITLDSRPSDAISLALRCRAPISVNDEVLERTETYSSIGSWLESRPHESDPEAAG